MRRELSVLGLHICSHALHIKEKNKTSSTEKPRCVQTRAFLEHSTAHKVTGCAITPCHPLALRLESTASIMVHSRVKEQSQNVHSFLRVTVYKVLM